MLSLHGRDGIDNWYRDLAWWSGCKPFRAARMVVPPAEPDGKKGSRGLDAEIDQICKAAKQPAATGCRAIRSPINAS